MFWKRYVCWSVRDRERRFPIENLPYFFVKFDHLWWVETSWWFIIAWRKQLNTRNFEFVSHFCKIVWYFSNHWKFNVECYISQFLENINVPSVKPRLLVVSFAIPLLTGMTQSGCTYKKKDSLFCWKHILSPQSPSMLVVEIKCHHFQIHVHFFSKHLPPILHQKRNINKHDDP